MSLNNNPSPRDDNPLAGIADLFPPADGTTDPRIVFYQMGYAAACNQHNLANPTTASRVGITRTLATAALVLIAVGGAFWAGRSVNQREVTTVAVQRSIEPPTVSTDAMQSDAGETPPEVIAEPTPTVAMTTHPWLRWLDLRTPIQAVDIDDQYRLDRMLGRTVPPRQDTQNVSSSNLPPIQLRTLRRSDSFDPNRDWSKWPDDA